MFETDALDVHPVVRCAVAGGELDPLADAEPGTVDHQTGKETFPDQTVADTQPDCVGEGRGQDAVGDRDIFGRAQRVAERFAVAPDGNGVVGGLDEAVGHGGEAAAVEVDPVVAAHARIAEDAKSGDRDEVAAVQETVPVGTVAQFAVHDPDVPAFAEEQHLPVPVFQLEKSIVRIDLIQPMGKTAVDGTALNGNVFALISDDQMSAVVLLVFAGAVRGTEVRGIPRLLFAAGKQDRARFQPQSGMAAQIDRAAFVNARRKNHFPACVDRPLDCLRVGRFAIAGRTEIPYVLHNCLSSSEKSI